MSGNGIEISRDSAQLIGQIKTKVSYLEDCLSNYRVTEKKLNNCDWFVGQAKNNFVVFMEKDLKQLEQTIEFYKLCYQFLNNALLTYEEMDAKLAKGVGR